jgi:phosphoribosylanthranilate isomerase
MTPVQIKICGVTNVNDARAAAELGADMIGLNFYPESPRYIEPEGARRIVEAMSRSVEAVGVFVDANPGEVRKIASGTGVRCIQLHGDTSPTACAELAREFRVIRVFCTDALFQPEGASSFPDCAVLVDAHHPNLRGGTGLICDWAAARATAPFARYLILSGALSAQNVGQAIVTVIPDAVDVCSGVESAPGVKDYRAIKNFIAAVRIAERSMSTLSAH